MNGFNRSAGATARPMTSRNLMGQVDGSRNPKPSDPDFDRRIFVPAGAAGAEEWMAGGSYAVVRRIRMLLDDWEKLPLGEQEKVIGRRKSDGAPLTGGAETAALDLNKRGPDGGTVIPDNAHARISAPEQNGGRRCCAGRSPSTTASVRTGLRTPVSSSSAGRRTRSGFVPVQRKLDRGDALSPFVRHESSGLFAVPGGSAEGEYVGQRLLEA